MHQALCIPKAQGDAAAGQASPTDETQPVTWPYFYRVHMSYQKPMKMTNIVCNIAAYQVPLKATEEEVQENKKGTKSKRGTDKTAAAAKTKPAPPPQQKADAPASPGEPSPNPAPAKRVKGKQAPPEVDQKQLIRELQEVMIMS